MFSNSISKKIIIIGGPTACGKSDLAIKIAGTLSGEIDSVIINADSMQVYKEIPIITAQPDADDLKKCEHKLYGFIGVEDEFSVDIWLQNVTREIDAALGNGKLPIIVGGTGMYIKSLMHGIADIPDIENDIRNEGRELIKKIGNDAFHDLLNDIDPVMADRIISSDSQRMVRAWEVQKQTGVSLSDWQKNKNKTFYNHDEFIGFFLNTPRDVLYENCNSRFLKMLDNNVMDEIKYLENNNVDPKLTSMKSLGVSELRSYYRDEITLDSAIEMAQQSTRRYAKRQVTWFKNQLPELNILNHANEIDIMDYIKLITI